MRLLEPVNPATRRLRFISKPPLKLSYIIAQAHRDQQEEVPIAMSISKFHVVFYDRNPEYSIVQGIKPHVRHGLVPRAVGMNPVGQLALV